MEFLWLFILTSILCGTFADDTFLGCYENEYSSPDEETKDAAMTVELCKSRCQAYNYSGLLNANRCQCYHNMGSLETVNSKKCDVACVGNLSQICGGIAVMSLYIAYDFDVTTTISVSAPDTDEPTTSLITADDIAETTVETLNPNTAIKYTTEFDRTIVQTSQYDTPTIQTTKFDTPTIQITKSDTPTVQTTQFDKPTIEITKSDTPAIQTTQFDTTTDQTIQYDTLTTETTQYDTPTIQTTKFDTLTIHITKSDTPTVQTTQFDTSTVQTSQFDTSTVQRTQFDTPPIQTTTSSCTCECPTASSTYWNNMTKKELIKKATANLAVEKTKTSSYIRSKISVYDNRPSCQRIGAVGLLLALLPLFYFILFDLIHFLKHTRVLKS